MISAGSEELDPGCSMPSRNDNRDANGSSRETFLSRQQGVHEAGFKEELRYELVADVAMAICQLTEREVEHDARPHIFAQVTLAYHSATSEHLLGLMACPSADSRSVYLEKCSDY